MLSIGGCCGWLVFGVLIGCLRVIPCVANCTQAYDDISIFGATAFMFGVVNIYGRHVIPEWYHEVDAFDYSEKD